MRPHEHSLLMVALVLVTASVAAHHSTAMFDVEREVILQGVVTAFDRGDPHVYVTIETENAAGDTRLVSIEGPAPIALRTVGWSQRSLTRGDRVLVVANPSLDADSTRVLGNSVLVEGGEYLAMGGVRLREALASQGGQ